MLQDGFDAVTAAMTARAAFTAVSVSASGADAKLALVACHGDADATGDSVLLDGTPISDGLNPPRNLINGTHSYLGQPVSNTGDLPQLTGPPGSLTGLDLDIVDISSLIKAGSSTFNVVMATSNDSYFVGALAASISTGHPVFANSGIESRSACHFTPSMDRRVISVTVPNTGSDASAGTTVSVPIPAGLSYVPGTLRIESGPGVGPKTDTFSDDEAEYNPNEGGIRARIGTGATATIGGSLCDNCPTTAKPEQTDANLNLVGDACEPVTRGGCRPSSLAAASPPASAAAAATVAAAILGVVLARRRRRYTAPDPVASGSRTAGSPSST